MKLETENPIHPNSMTTQDALLDNISHAILELNATLIDVKEILQSVVLKIGITKEEKNNG